MTLAAETKRAVIADYLSGIRVDDITRINHIGHDKLYEALREADIPKRGHVGSRRPRVLHNGEVARSHRRDRYARTPAPTGPRGICRSCGQPIMYGEGFCDDGRGLLHVRPCVAVAA